MPVTNLRSFRYSLFQTPSRLLAICAVVVLSACSSSEEDPVQTDLNSTTPTIVSVQGDGPLPELFEADPNCPGPYAASQITDLVLATGQSNLIGADTEVAAITGSYGQVLQFQAPDLPHPRVFAWTVDAADNNAGLGWQVARLTQSWHDSKPGVGGIANNNFAFHFAKQLATQADGCRVVGLVMVAEGGKGIAHWDEGATGMYEVQRHVTEAMGAIGRTTIDGILWHQGESDWIVDGSCFPDDICVNGQPDFYAQKLYSRIANPDINNPVGESALIDRLRRQSWFGDDKPFIAAETLIAPVNVHLNKLNSDNDPWTACVRGDLASGLEPNPLDPSNTHYSANGLRDLGARYAQAYITMQGRSD